MHFDAPLRQLVGDDAGRPHLLEADLGMRVQVAPDRGELVGEAFNAVNQGHVCNVPIVRLRE